MNRILKKYPMLMIVVIGFIGYACNFGDLDFDNIEDPVFTPELVAPIGEVTYTIKELIDEINDPSIEVNEANSKLLSVIYRDTSIYNTPEDLIVVDDVTQQRTVEPGISIINTPVDVSEVFSQTMTIEYPTQNSERLDSIIYAGGDIEVIIQSQIQADVDLEIILVDFVEFNTRDTIKFNSSLSYSGSLPVSDQQTHTLTNHRSALTEVGGQNVFDVIVNGTINLTAGQSVGVTDFLLVTINTSNTTFSSVIGYFGEDQIVVQDQTIDIEFFKDIEPFGLEFNSPEIIVNFNNSFGVPIGIDLSAVNSTNDNGDFRTLNGTITQELQVMRAPDVSDFGQTLGSSFSISNENSNLQELLSISPSRISLPITATTNSGNTNQDANFYTADSQVETIIEVNMPLDVKLDGFTQTFDFDIADVDFDDADSIKLVVTTINDLPFNGSMSLYLLDADSAVIHQVPDNLILQSPEVGSDGRSVEPLTHVEEVLLNTEGVIAFAAANKIALVLVVDSFEATNNRFVRIFSDYELVIKIGGIANLNFTL